jgi:hypothetical protein
VDINRCTPNFETTHFHPHFETIANFVRYQKYYKCEGLCYNERITPSCWRFKLSMQSYSMWNSTIKKKDTTYLLYKTSSGIMGGGKKLLMEKRKSLYPFCDAIFFSNY